MTPRSGLKLNSKRNNPLKSFYIYLCWNHKARNEDTMSDTPIWNYKEFRTYLLLYAANADLDFSAEEESMILSTISESSYKKVKSVYDDANVYGHIQTILKYKGLYFPTADQAKELVDLLVKMFNVDGKFSVLERNSLMILKKMI